MASIFTFDPSPPSVSSPWSTPRTSTPRLTSNSSNVALAGTDLYSTTALDPDSTSGVIVTSLEAEPQGGPTEYKLHLLLRTRREFIYSSTSGRVPGSRRTPSGSTKLTGNDEAVANIQSLQLSVSAQNTRQNRLEHLTTQLLWRLQQTSSYHYTTYKQTPMPSLIPVDNDKLSPKPVFPGLEDSKGALYEIGVADDGSFVGLAEDELEESLQTLGTMAASLGCTVSILKKVAIGDCQWLETTPVLASDGKPTTCNMMKSSKLWVAEAYVRPNLGNNQNKLHSFATSEPEPQPLSVINQLRVTLTGATLSGKSSLLGTLTTATLDNGRGKSRLSLLKHQHEIATGMTSSVTHELLGYTIPDMNGNVHVINFASGNVTSWIDIHASCENGRLVFLSDSAGHPRFRRTTVRGIVGWAPHWTILCIPADGQEDTTGRLGNTPPSYETPGLPSLDVDLSEDHLQLCLKLKIPLVVVITKRDLATNTGLRTCLNKLLSALKRNGRLPFLLTRDSANDMSTILDADLKDVARHIADLKKDPHTYVPIVLVSALKGTGIKTLHALFHELPIPQPPISPNRNVTALFDIEDIYNSRTQDTQSIILSGAVRLGRISVGDELLIGPFQTKIASSSNSHANRPRPHLSTLAFRSTSPDISSLAPVPPSADHEWYKVRVCSARHLRLPTHALVADQVGTVAVIPVTNSADDNAAGATAWHTVRKGMVLCNGTPSAHRVFVAQFARRDVDPLSIGSAVVVYFNSVRASAKIVAGAIVASEEVDESHDESHDEEEAFALDDEDEDENEQEEAKVDERLLVTFRFLAAREYVAVGSRVLVMPGGAAGLYGGGTRGEKGVAGLKGFVGRVVESGVSTHVG